MHPRDGQAWAQLIRLPNLFTALADVGMGFLITQPWPPNLLLLGLLAASSGCLYSAGMVLNDLFDVRTDLSERPQRPLPSGRISLRQARRCAIGLIGGGLLAALLAAGLGRDVRPVAVAGALTAAIYLYDGPLKPTLFAPPVMGACRTLNVLLGMSLLEGAWRPLHLAVAVGLGLYVAGITWFARREARASRRAQLAWGAAVALGGLMLMGSLPLWSGPDLPAASVPAFALSAGPNWYALWGLLGGLSLLRFARAIAEPTPVRVQSAVKIGILSIVILDAAVVMGVRGPGAAVAVAALLLPAALLGRWLYST